MIVAHVGAQGCARHHDELPSASRGVAQHTMSASSNQHFAQRFGVDDDLAPLSFVKKVDFEKPKLPSIIDDF